jgi:hypothetical protein
MKKFQVKGRKIGDTESRIYTDGIFVDPNCRAYYFEGSKLIEFEPGYILSWNAIEC